MNPTLLRELILAGHRVACKDIDWYRKVFLHITSEWYFMWTLCDKDINVTISDRLSNTKLTKSHVQEHLTWEYKIVTPLPQLPQVWDTVEVLDICRELPWFDREWSESMKNMVWKKLVVKNITLYWDVQVYTEYMEDLYTFSPRMVAKYETDKEPTPKSEEKSFKTMTLDWVKYELREIVE